MSEVYVDSGYVDQFYANEGLEILWGTKIIFVPKSETTVVQTNPTEVRQLDLNKFRNALKNLEDTEEGAPFPPTHQHNTTVTVGGVTLARVIEIINGYTVTFEDGQYAVNLVGANSNVGDVVNVNQVSVRVANSAGLTDMGGTVPPTTAEIVAALLAAAQATPIYADARKMNGATITGTGTSGDKWRGI